MPSLRLNQVTLAAKDMALSIFMKNSASNVSSIAPRAMSGLNFQMMAMAPKPRFLSTPRKATLCPLLTRRSSILKSMTLRPF